MYLINKIKKVTPEFIIKFIKYYLNDFRNFYDFLKYPFEKITEDRKKKLWKNKEEIQEYRKNIKIYDTFLFFNELELLEIRLNVLGPYVDYFVIVEATETFTGTPKKLYFEENKDLFKKWEHKIIHYVIKDTPKDEKDLEDRLHLKILTDLDRKIIKDTLNSDNIPHGKETQWLREFYQKESIKKALLGLKDNDLCFLSDLDEIWNPEIIIDYSQDLNFRFKQKAYIYFLNNRSNENWIGWTGTTATKFNNIKNGCLNYIRTKQKTAGFVLQNGGWHFSFQGGSENVKQKLESYGHQEINTQDIKSKMNDTIMKNKDIRGRHIKFWIDNKNLPNYLKENREKYKEMFLS